ncbi:MAG: hypothetical protein CML17_02355 [Pusillimonas sp.]|jgi:hypothetical protein|nr:hypothetical protein [Pusillimonas sp.]|tara:strand:+ start:2648 stop:2839 length:192 start_codon:yes stop_codon:yes gene_type:complete
MQFLVVGVLFLITPLVMFINDGGRDEADMTSWFVNQPLQTIFTLRAMTISGIGFIGIGILMIV